MDMVAVVIVSTHEASALDARRVPAEWERHRPPLLRVPLARRLGLQGQRHDNAAVFISRPAPRPRSSCWEAPVVLMTKISQRHVYCSSLYALDRSVQAMAGCGPLEGRGTGRSKTPPAPGSVSSSTPPLPTPPPVKLLACDSILNTCTCAPPSRSAWGIPGIRCPPSAQRDKRMPAGRYAG